MTDYPNRPPLWLEMRTAYDCSTAPNGSTDDWTERDGFAAEIRALRDWIEKRQVDEYGVTLPDVCEVIGWLTAEADRAERGDD